MHRHLQFKTSICVCSHCVKIITAVPDLPVLASFRSEFLDATYAVVFPQTVTGAVALHRFATMISGQYGKQVELQLTNDLFPIRNKPVEDILNTIGIPHPVGG